MESALHALDEGSTSIAPRGVALGGVASPRHRATRAAFHSLKLEAPRVDVELTAVLTEGPSSGSLPKPDPRVVMNKTHALRAGFSSVELAVVVVVIGVLAAFAVPRFMSSVERSRATEAFAYSSTVYNSQERYHARNGTYAALLASLDSKIVSPEYFTVGEISVPRGHDDFKTGGNRR